MDRVRETVDAYRARAADRYSVGASFPAPKLRVLPDARALLHPTGRSERRDDVVVAVRGLEERPVLGHRCRILFSSVDGAERATRRGTTVKMVPLAARQHDRIRCIEPQLAGVMRTEVAVEDPSFIPDECERRRRPSSISGAVNSADQNTLSSSIMGTPVAALRRPPTRRPQRCSSLPTCPTRCGGSRCGSVMA